MMSYKTSANRKYAGSPTFTADVGTLSAEAVTVLDFEQNASQQEKYAPYNRMTIINTSSVAIKIYPNQDDNNVYTIPSGVIREFDKTSIPALRSLRVENVSTTTGITAGEVTIEYQKEVVDSEKIVQTFAQKLFRVGDTV